MGGNLPIQIPYKSGLQPVLPQAGMPNMTLPQINLPTIKADKNIFVQQEATIDIPFSEVIPEKLEDIIPKKEEENLLLKKTEDFAIKTKIAIGDIAEKMTPLLQNFHAVLPSTVVSLPKAMLPSVLGNQEASLLGIISILLDSKTYALPSVVDKEFEKRIKEIQEKLFKGDSIIGLRNNIELSKHIKENNMDFVDRALNLVAENNDLSSTDKYSLFVNSLEKAHKRELIPLIEKILQADEYKLFPNRKETYLDLIKKDPVFAEELLESNKIRGKDKVIILKNLKYLDKNFIKKIMDNEKFTQTGRSAIIQQSAKTIQKWKKFPFMPYPKKCQQLIEKILDNEKIEPFFIPDIIETIKKSNMNTINEILENDNIHSCDKPELISVLKESNIEYSRENIFNNPHINSCDMSNIISEISDIDNGLREMIKNKLLYNNKLNSSDIAKFISEINKNHEKDPKFIDYVLYDDNIPSIYKSVFFSYVDEDNFEWMKQLAAHEDKEMAVFLASCEQMSFDKESYRKKAIDFIENKCSEKNLLSEIYSFNKSLVENGLLLRRNPNIHYFDLSPILHSTNENIVNEFLNGNYMSIVKSFSEQTSENEILKKTQESDVIQIGEQLYINDGDKLFKWNMTKEAFDKLFPPFKRFYTSQGTVGNCYLVAVLIGLMNSPKGRKILYKSFSQEGNDILCTIRGYKDYGGTIRFKEGKLPKANTGIEACLGLQMIEKTYNEVALMESYGVNHSKNEFLNDYDRLCGGFTIDAFIDLTGAKETSNLEDNFKHKVIEIQQESIGTGFLTKYVNNKNNCCFVSFGEGSKMFNIFGDHAYVLDHYDALSDDVYLINPHNSLSTKKIGFGPFYIFQNSLTICNLEEVDPN